MIEILSRAYKTNMGIFEKIVDAQAAELLRIIESSPQLDNQTIAKTLVDHAKQVVDILTTTKDSRPRRRRINGGTTKRKPKAVAEPMALPFPSGPA